MSKKVLIGSEEFDLSLSGDPAGWGEKQSDLLEAMIDSINAFYGPGDILPTSTLIGNGVGTLGDPNTFQAIPYFQFDTSLVRFAETEFTVIRITDTQTIYEVGKIFVLNDPTSLGNPWSINVQNMSESSAGIEFDINSSGQVTYGTSTMSGTYSTSESKINFKSKAIIK